MIPYPEFAILARTRLVMWTPTRITREDGRVTYSGSHIRISAPVHPSTEALVLLSAVGDDTIAPQDEFARTVSPDASDATREILNSHGHVVLPLMWAWAYGKLAGLPEHPAGEPRYLFQPARP